MPGIIIFIIAENLLLSADYSDLYIADFEISKRIVYDGNISTREILNDLHAIKCVYRQLISAPDNPKGKNITRVSC